MLQITWMCLINFINTTINSKCIGPKGGNNRIHVCSQPTVTGSCLGIHHLIFREWTLVFIRGVHHLILLLLCVRNSPPIPHAGKLSLPPYHGNCNPCSQSRECAAVLGNHLHLHQSLSGKRWETEAGWECSRLVSWLHSSAVVLSAHPSFLVPHHFRWFFQ